MAEYTVDYIKEKAKANYELIKILSLLSVTIGVATISLLREVDFSKGVDSAPLDVRFWIVSGIIVVTGLIVIVAFLVVDTNALLRKLNTPQSKEL